MLIFCISLRHVQLLNFTRMEDNRQIFQIPTTDFSFKRIFGTEANKLLIHFLNCFVAKYTYRRKLRFFT